MEKNDLKQKILNEEDWIHCPKHQNSLQKFLAKNDGLVENTTIARFLMITPDEVEEIYQDSVEKIREGLQKDGEFDEDESNRSLHGRISNDTG